MGLVGIRGGNVAKSKYHFLLQYPIFYGVIRFNGELHEGRHEPLITKKLFGQAQKVMSQRSRPKSKASKPYLYKGVFTCGECGCMVTHVTQEVGDQCRAAEVAPVATGDEEVVVVPCADAYGKITAWAIVNYTESAKSETWPEGATGIDLLIDHTVAPTLDLAPLQVLRLVVCSTVHAAFRH